MNAIEYGHSARRREDDRLVTGRGEYADDVRHAGALHAVFVRSPYPSATVRSIDVAAALALPGVVAVLTGADMAADGFIESPVPFKFPQGDGSFAIETPRPFLVRDRVRHVGEPVAMVLAETATAGVDAEGVDGRGPVVGDHAPLAPGPVVDASVLPPLADRLREQQRVFERTGGLHAAGLFTAAGVLVTLREDIGRHNAVDKVVGRALLDRRVPPRDALLAVSGRAGYEVVQKAVAAGIPILVAVGAPSSLAIELAADRGITLCGFVRGGKANVYTEPWRIVV